VGCKLNGTIWGGTLVRAAVNPLSLAKKKQDVEEHE